MSLIQVACSYVTMTVYIQMCTCLYALVYVWSHGPLARYVKWQVAHALGMPGTFSPPPRVSDPDMHHGTCVTHLPRYMPGLLTRGFLWSRWRGIRFSAFPAHARPAIFLSGKRPMVQHIEVMVAWYHCNHSWGVLCQKQVSRAVTSNYIPQIMWDVKCDFSMF